MDSIASRLDSFIAEAAARDRETDQRFRDTDTRIDKLVSAIVEFIPAPQEARSERHWRRPAPA